MTQFEDRISSFTVTFPNHTLLSEETVSWIASLGQHGLSDSQCIALALLREQGSLDNRAYRAATGVDSRVATAELQDLVARELLVQAGTRRLARYRLSPLLDGHPNGPSARTDRRPPSSLPWAARRYPDRSCQPAPASTTPPCDAGSPSCATREPSNLPAPARAAGTPATAARETKPHGSSRATSQGAGTGMHVSPLHKHQKALYTLRAFPDIS